MFGSSMGFFRTLVADDAGGVYAFAREWGDERAYVVLNRSDGTREITVPLDSDAADGRPIIDWLDADHAELTTGKDGRPELRARSGAKGTPARDGALRIRLAAYGSSVLAAPTR